MRRSLLLVAIAAYLLPVWGTPILPTQDGASHALNARIFRECEREGAREHEFYARRLEPVPNWTAQALLLGLTTVVPPDAAEKVLASLYLIGLPLALVYFLSALGLSGERALFGLLLLFNRCFFLGFSNYLLSLVLYFVVLGAFMRWSEAPRPAEVTRLALLLLLVWFTHLFGYLLAAASLGWLAVTGPGAKKPRSRSLGLALVPSVLLTLAYLVASGFFDSSVARRAARGVQGFASGLPAALHRELFAVYADAWPLGLFGLLAVALWAGLARAKVDDGGGPSGLGAWRRSLASLAAVLLVAFVVVPDHLGAQGGFLKARLAPVPFLLGLSLLPHARPRGSRALGIVPLLLLLGLNLYLVRSHMVAASRDLEEFTAAAALVRPGETLAALKPRLEPPLVDIRAAEHYCLVARAVCLDNYEAATRHFPVRLRPGVKDRLKQNRPGTFWADVLLAWDADPDQLPRPEEPYREIYSRGSLRVFRRE
jgi:hypothetical protein